MLSLASLNKMKGQVFQKHACVHPKHEKHSPGVPGFSVHSSSYLRILTCRPVLNAVHAQVTHIAGHLERKVNSIFSGKKKWSNSRMQKGTEENSAEIGNWFICPLSYTSSSMRNWLDPPKILSGDPQLSFGTRISQMLFHLSLFQKMIQEEKRNSWFCLENEKSEYFPSWQNSCDMLPLSVAAWKNTSVLNSVSNDCYSSSWAGGTVRGPSLGIWHRVLQEQLCTGTSSCLRWWQAVPAALTKCLH